MNEPKPRPTRTSRTALRLDPELLAQAKVAAANEDRTLSAWIVQAIRRALGKVEP